MGATPEKKSPLVAHAIREMKFVGLDLQDADYGGAVYDKVLDLITMFSEQGHSGASAEIVGSLFYTLIQFRPLGPLTEEPSEWKEVTKEVLTPEQIKEGQRIWQNLRSPSVFSRDGGKTYRDMETKTDGKSMTREEALNAVGNNPEKNKQAEQGTPQSPSGSEGSDSTEADGGVSTERPTESEDAPSSGPGKESGSVEGSERPVQADQHTDGRHRAEAAKRKAKGGKKGSKAKTQGGQA